jgi:glycosyltransferase involved in cell wall biosynthesis
MSKYLCGVTLITTLFNESQNILRFLESYKNQTKYADEFIIVDGGSRDGTEEIIREYSSKNPELNIRIIVDTKCSRKYTSGPIAKGRNIAIENARNEIIAVTDAGCILDNNWLEEITKPFDTINVEVVSGWYQALTDNQFQRIYSDLFIPKVQTLDTNNFLPSSRSIAFKKECWKEVGGYPTATYTAEDTMFDLSLLNRGFSFVFEEKAIVFWECPNTLAAARLKSYDYAYGDGQYKIFKKHYLKQLIHLIFPIKCFIKNTMQDIGWVKLFNIKYQLTFFTVLGYIKGLFVGTSSK